MTAGGAPSYSTIEVSRRLGISLQTVQRWVDSGRLKAWKTPGGHRRIDARSAETLFQEHGQALGPALEAPVEPVSHAQFQAVQVVIVDDDPMDRELLSMLVHAALPHARVRVAANGFQGLVMIAQAVPDIVVTDVHMPHMDGFEMIRNLLADPSTRPRLVIAASARSAEELTDFGQLPEEVLLLRKPVDRPIFTAALQRL